jgi:hypothetical protein
MPAIPGNRLKIIHSNNTPDYSLSNQGAVGKQNEARVGTPDVADSEMAEVKSRMAAILDRMKSRADEITSNEAPDLQHGLEHLLSIETQPAADAARFLREAELIKAEAEAKTRTAERALSEIEMRAELAEATALEADARARAAEQVVHEIEQMVYESDAIATELQKKYKAAEARMLVERGLRLYAEQQLSALAVEIENAPEIDEQHINIEVSLASPQERKMLAYDDPYPQLIAQIEAEKQSALRAEQARDEAVSRIEAEKQSVLRAERARDEAMNRVASSQASLEQAKDKLTKVEAFYEDVLRTHQIELRELKQSMAEAIKAASQVPARAEAAPVFSPARSEEQDAPLSDETRRIVLQMVAYSAAALVLLGVLAALAITIYQQL